MSVQLQTREGARQLAGDFAFRHIMLVNFKNYPITSGIDHTQNPPNDIIFSGNKEKAQKQLNLSAVIILN